MSKEEMNERYMATAKSDGTLDVKWYVENNRLYRRVWKRVKGWTLPVEYTKAEMAHVMTGIENRLVDIVATKGYAPSNETNETTKTRIKTMCENNKNVKKKDEEREKDSNASRYSTFGVITRNKPEASYMIQWCEAKGWPPPTSLGKIAKFPWVACLDFVREDTAWTDRLDRAMEYKTFAEFIEQNAQVDRLSTAGEKDKTMNNEPKAVATLRLPPVRSDDLLDACIQELERLQSNVCEEDYDSIQRILDRASNVCDKR